MPPISAAEKQKLLLQQEIAKLSGAISRHATNPAPSHHHHHHPYARGSFRGSRGNNRGRGRGRGGSYGLDLRAANSAAKASSSPALQPSSTSGTASPLPLASQSNAQAGPSRASPVKDIEKEAGEVSPSPSPKPKHAEVVPSAPVVEQNWVKGMSKRGNMSLMTEKKSNHLKSLPPKPKVKKSRIPANVQVLSSASTSEGQRVVIDGVIFQFEQGGKKLARIGEVSPVTKTGTSASEDTPTRRKLSYGGNDYRRTRGGNLVQSKRSKLATTPCRYFTKTGRCNRALTCPYAHNPDRLSICPKFLRGTCPNTLATCPLSHTPSPHNTPSCVHFQATQTCRNGSDCLYPHVKVADNAPICESFTEEGYCDVTPAGTCPKLHVWECGEWREKGTCSKGGKCGLRHVLRAEKGKQREAALAGDVVTYEKDVTAEGGIKSFEDGTAFINFDQGSPPVVSSEDEDGAEADGDEDMEPHHVDQGHASGEEENASEDDGESGDSEEEDDDEGSEDDEDLVLDIVA